MNAIERKALEAMGIIKPFDIRMPWGTYWFEGDRTGPMREGHIESDGRIVEWSE